ncbi:hypothetical protein [Thiocapsa bogorovii]|uniref:hypothetical protein n=1 Tax=Thiocapsa bogorovii TaxID=521689 RepID=UPI001E3C5992|nr:hypothetical protein [Thiocapsa bogorovii]UHD15029.1 hypothetical protein LT988_17310 [Thiocapsa bogorovii]
MVDKSDEIRSTIRGIMGESVPKPRPSELAMPSLSIDIGGINLKNHNAFERAHPDHRIDLPAIAAAPPAAQRCHRQHRSILRVLCTLLLFAAIAPLYLVEFLSDMPDNIILTIGFVALLLSMISFTIATMLEPS